MTAANRWDASPSRHSFELRLADRMENGEYTEILIVLRMLLTSIAEMAGDAPRQRTLSSDLELEQIDVDLAVLGTTFGPASHPLS